MSFAEGNEISLLRKKKITEDELLKLTVDENLDEFQRAVYLMNTNNQTQQIATYVNLVSLARSDLSLFNKVVFPVLIRDIPFVKVQEVVVNLAIALEELLVQNCVKKKLVTSLYDKVVEHMRHHNTKAKDDLWIGTLRNCLAHVTVQEAIDKYIPQAQEFTDTTQQTMRRMSVNLVGSLAPKFKDKESLYYVQEALPLVFKYGSDLHYDLRKIICGNFFDVTEVVVAAEAQSGKDFTNEKRHLLSLLTDMLDDEQPIVRAVAITQVDKMINTGTFTRQIIQESELIGTLKSQFEDKKVMKMDSDHIHALVENSIKIVHALAQIDEEFLLADSFSLLKSMLKLYQAVVDTQEKATEETRALEMAIQDTVDPDEELKGLNNQSEPPLARDYSLEQKLDEEDQKWTEQESLRCTLVMNFPALTLMLVGSKKLKRKAATKLAKKDNIEETKSDTCSSQSDTSSNSIFDSDQEAGDEEDPRFKFFSLNCLSLLKHLSEDSSPVVRAEAATVLPAMIEITGLHRSKKCPMVELFWAFFDDQNPLVITGLFQEIQKVINTLTYKKFQTELKEKWVKSYSKCSKTWRLHQLYLEKTIGFLPLLEDTVAKKYIPKFIKTINSASKPVQLTLCQLLIEILKLPNLDLQAEIQDLVNRYMIQSQSGLHRVLFVDFAVMATDHFSRKFYQDFFDGLLLHYQREKAKHVAITFIKNAPILSKMLDFDITSKGGRQFEKKKDPSHINFTLLSLEKRFLENPRCSYLLKRLKESHAKISSSASMAEYLTDDELQRDWNNSKREEARVKEIKERRSQKESLYGFSSQMKRAPVPNKVLQKQPSLPPSGVPASIRRKSYMAQKLPSSSLLIEKSLQFKEKQIKAQQKQGSTSVILPKPPLKSGTSSAQRRSVMIPQKQQSLVLPDRKELQPQKNHSSHASKRTSSRDATNRNKTQL